MASFGSLSSEDRNKSTIARLFDRATASYKEISDIHRKLLKYGYNKPYRSNKEDPRTVQAFSKSIYLLR